MNTLVVRLGSQVCANITYYKIAWWTLQQKQAKINRYLVLRLLDVRWNFVAGVAFHVDWAFWKAVIIETSYCYNNHLGKMLIVFLSERCIHKSKNIFGSLASVSVDTNGPI